MKNRVLVMGGARTGCFECKTANRGNISTYETSYNRHIRECKSTICRSVQQILN